ncbi:hypothetical protein D6D17_08085 [Aureobasidium pullulans]|nr:hypothetical protein D6D17_08085 [Aureobasidium pullulans]
MHFAIFIFISTSLALLIPRCDTGDHASSSIDARELSPSAAVVATSASKSTYPYTKKIKTVSTQPTTTPLPTRALTTEVEDPEDCVPHSICVDKISPCGKRYGGRVVISVQAAAGSKTDTDIRCYDENFCDGNTSPYPIPTCPTMVTKKREAVPAPTITPA